MRISNRAKALMLIFPLLVGGINVAQAKKMYRWIDENGNVYFSDLVPPDQVQHKRETLNEKARVLDSVEKAKSAEQLEQQRRLDALRKQQDKIIAQQATNDKVLLTTYRSLDDMLKAIASKRDSMEAEHKMLESNLQRAEQQLLKQQQQAANLERNASKVPGKLLAEIAASKQQIEAAKQELQRQALEREKSEKTFQADLARFQFLTQSSGENKAAGNNLAVSNTNNELGLFVCQDAEQCDKAWKIAGEFVGQYSTTGQDVETEQLIMRAAPVNDEDLSLSVSKLSKDQRQQIFLDIRCKESVLGKELCASAKAQAIRQGFAAYLQLQLSAQ